MLENVKNILKFSFLPYTDCKGMLYMKKLLLQNLKRAIIFFVVISIFNRLFRGDFKWGEGIMFSIAYFVVYFIVDWANIPYDWKKKKTQ